jgi:hypothetical protein
MNTFFFGGKRVALVLLSGDKRYFVEDSLGSSRVIASVGFGLLRRRFHPLRRREGIHQHLLAELQIRGQRA